MAKISKKYLRKTDDVNLLDILNISMDGLNMNQTTKSQEKSYETEGQSVAKCNSIQSIAKCYLRGGFSVIPVKRNSKEPSIKWGDYRTRQMEEISISEYFNNDCNISIVTGAISNLTVIDIDEVEKFNQFYDFEKLKSEAKTVVKSPRGWHFWFKHEPEIESKQFKNLGFDVKNENSLIMVPPSKINEHSYKFLKSDGVGAIPEELKQKIISLQKSKNVVGDEFLNEILRRVKVTNKISDHVWRCICPAHDDKEPSLDVGLKNGKLYIKCWAGCSKEEVLQAIGIEPELKKDKKESVAKKLLQLVENFELWINQNDEKFITVFIDGRIKNIKIDSKEFRDLLQFFYFQKYGKPTHTQAILEAISTLSGKALCEGKKVRSFVRIGKLEDIIELDLVNKVVRITADEITTTNPLCKFVSSTSLLPLPLPDLDISKDDWKLLKIFVNSHEKNIILALAWLIGCFNIDGEFPVLNIIGEREGIGKSTASKFLKSTIDPTVIPIKPLPKTEDDLLTVCLHNHIVAFDNLSHLSDNMSDAICRVSTASGLAKRKLYTDADVVLYFVKNPLILNGIDFFAERRDLRRRCIHIELQKLTDPKPITQLESEFNFYHPRLLGWLCKAVQLALKEKIKSDINLTDMASFVEFVCKTEKIFPVNAKEFVETFKSNRSYVSVATISENPIVSFMLELLEDGDWGGTISELHEKISQKFNYSPVKNQIPKDAKSLSRKIRRMLTDLECINISCEFSRDSKSTYIHIKKIEKNNTIKPLTPLPLKTNDSNSEDILLKSREIKNNTTISESKNHLKNNDYEDDGDMEIKKRFSLMNDEDDELDIDTNEIDDSED